MKFERKYRWNLYTEDGNYVIVKDHVTESYYIKDNRSNKKLISGFCRLSFGRQKDAISFIERMYAEGLNENYRWL